MNFLFRGQNNHYLMKYYSTSTWYIGRKHCWGLRALTHRRLLPLRLNVKTDNAFEAKANLNSTKHPGFFNVNAIKSSVKDRNCLLADYRDYKVIDTQMGFKGKIQNKNIYLNKAKVI